MKDMVNNPIVVVAILGGIAVFLREIFWFIKSMTQKTPTHDVNRSLERVAESLHELNANIRLQLELGKEQQRSLIRHIDELKAEVKGNK